jgi:MtN3 and saliva related transmembrane protein
MNRFHKVTLAVLPSLVTLCGCQSLTQDTQSLLFSGFKRSEVFGIVAGFGTTFAGVPDLLAMLRRRSTAGMNPRMAAIMCIFQILWAYYGLLIVSPPVVLWNFVGVLVNALNVGAYFYFLRQEKAAHAQVAGQKEHERMDRSVPAQRQRWM